ncbi:peptidyl-prolyl cis-trans isomerase-like protein, partial [Trifolium medium]|nr:peptidyl-prolyl cis-trans isomerase-like protein [Trifolium medium]
SLVRMENFEDHSRSRGRSDQEMAGSNNGDRYANRSRGLEGNGDDKAIWIRGMTEIIGRELKTVEGKM